MGCYSVSFYRHCNLICSFYRAALNATRSSHYKTVCPFVTRVDCDKTKAPIAKKVQLSLIGSPLLLFNEPKMNSARTLPLSPPPRGAQKRKVIVFRIKVDLSCKRSMLLVFWHRQRLVQSIVWPTPSPTTHHDPPCMQRGFSATAELLVSSSNCMFYIFGPFVLIFSVMHDTR